MIIGNIERHKNEAAHYAPALERALAYLQQHDFTKMETGRYELEGEGGCLMYANLDRYDTKPVEICHPEAHKRYVDVQYIVEGQEYMGWCMQNPDLKVYEEYDAERDIMFYEKLVPESVCVLKPGDFAILEPRDVHRPCGMIGDKPEPVTKVVVKVCVDLLQENCDCSKA